MSLRITELLRQALWFTIARRWLLFPELASTSGGDAYSSRVLPGIHSCLDGHQPKQAASFKRLWMAVECKVRWITIHLEDTYLEEHFLWTTIIPFVTINMPLMKQGYMPWLAIRWRRRSRGLLISHILRQQSKPWFQRKLSSTEAVARRTTNVLHLQQSQAINLPS